jgi:hypothetical protein
MKNIINIYCDESCYMENDPYKVFVLGAIWTPQEKTKEIFREIRSIKEKHNIPSYFEVKWVKISPSKLSFYSELIDYFFSNPNLNFRGVLVPDKKILNHGFFKQTHEEWYYKMYYELLRIILNPEFNPDSSFNIYMDYKDSASGRRLKNLREVLCKSQYDFQMEKILQIQPVNSKEIELVQITDLLLGAIGYINRELHTSKAKLAICEQIKTCSGLTLRNSTTMMQKKVNLLVWQPTKDNKND